MCFTICLLRTKPVVILVDILTVKTTEYAVLKTHLHCMKPPQHSSKSVLVPCVSKRIVGPMFFKKNGGEGSTFSVDCVWNVMALAQTPDFVFRRNGQVHLNRQGRQFSRLLAAVMWASAIVMLDTPCSELVNGTGYPLHSLDPPLLPLPFVTTCRQVSTGLYLL